MGGLLDTLDVPGPLTEHEQEVVTGFERGHRIKLRPNTPIRPELIRALCVHAASAPAGRAAGLRIEGAAIPGRIDLEGLDIPFPLRLRRCTLGQLVITDARLVSLSLAGSTCTGVTAGRVSVTGSMRLNAGFAATGRVWMPGASIGGDFDCTSAQLGTENENAALLLDGTHIAGRVFLRGGETRLGKSDTHRWFEVCGRVRAMNARFDRGLICTPHARFAHEDGIAVELYALRTNGWATFTGAEIHGGLQIATGHIGGQLTLASATIMGELDLEAVEIDGNLNLSDTELGPRTTIRGSRIAGSADFTRAWAGYSREIDAAGSTIGGRLVWKDVKYEPKSAEGPPFMPSVSVAHAQAAVLDDDPGAWPRGHNLTLEGFSYRGLDIPGDLGVGPRSSLARLRRHRPEGWLGARIDWLLSQPCDRWSPYPYGQLAAALRQAGHDSAARVVSIERERQRRHRGGLNRASKLANRIVGLTIGYGYRPWIALVWAAIVMAVGAAVFSHLHPRDFTIKDNPPVYHPLGYSIDAFLPIVNLHQEDARTPKALGWSIYLWIHIALGWLLTTLGIAGVTGLIRRE